MALNLWTGERPSLSKVHCASIRNDKALQMTLWDPGCTVLESIFYHTVASKTFYLIIFCFLARTINDITLRSLIGLR